MNSSTDSDVRFRSDESPSPSVIQPPGAFLALLAGFAAGWTTWAASPEVVGVAEAWDALLYYSIWLFAGGFVAGLIAPRYWYLGFVGAWFAQVAYIEFVYRAALPPGDPVLMPSFIAAALFGSIQPLIGGAAGAALAKLLRSDDGPNADGGSMASS